MGKMCTPSGKAVGSRTPPIADTDRPWRIPPGVIRLHL